MASRHSGETAGRWLGHRGGIKPHPASTYALKSEMTVNFQHRRGRGEGRGERGGEGRGEGRGGVQVQ